VEDTGRHYTSRAAQAMINILDEQMLLSLQDERIFETAERFILPWSIDIEDRMILNLANMVIRIIDYKSTFTMNHSAQIANRIWLMGTHYGYALSVQSQLYLAAALHDLGKLSVPSSILEKPGKLDEGEFHIIKSHVAKTHELLKDIPGLENVCNWASNHHEKLDGTGYPFGKTAAELDFNSRLMTCIDIYQAVSEKRPYHSGRSHEDTMAILYDMAGTGAIDKNIVKDIDEVMAPYSHQAVPSPENLCR
jgi:HD-GYP domain-containing protein (c-di-GMP phosphodiesterase class II)